MSEEANQAPEEKQAEPIAPPPVIYLACLLLGLTLDYTAPLGFFGGEWSYPVATLLMAAGIGFMYWAISTLHRADTAIDPRGKPTTMIMTGPFQYSRNPAYVGVTLLYYGIACAFGSVWLALLGFAGLALTHFFVILREEEKLARIFGEDYLNYKNKVRRWV